MTQPRSRPAKLSGGERLLFLTDDQLRQGVELMFFAYRDMVADADRVLAERGYGRAHHRCLHFIWRRPGLSVAELLDILSVTKQSLNRVLRQLVRDGLVESRVGQADRRQRLLRLTPRGEELVRDLANAQNARMRRVFLEAGPEAVHGFKTVLAGMIDEGRRAAVLDLVEDRFPEGGKR
ncbi:MarR family winged helix-turn-helix transcriptional regulator [Oceanicella actignis]|uniref:DNA-binding transcriptional regulator, MarR family n=1 Tax=Oceanicella actignis TaxID=1189325 RepID=A0A1M7T3Q2_9RHOB|nr:MarR family transcriptional regulator [Oceanicella actignis]SET40260.1 DNA-binding transcriptional regulator, MarR family [Oceanicella actignis]SHN65316.1 DNA-binding transcriptional regulator, MarR family [Oceanicella actignis]